MPESTQYRTFFLEATYGVFLLVERWVEVLSCACEALVFDGVDGSVGASSQLRSSLADFLQCVLLKSCLIHFLSLTLSLRHYVPRLLCKLCGGRGACASYSKLYFLYILRSKTACKHQLDRSLASSLLNCWSNFFCFSTNSCL